MTAEPNPQDPAAEPQDQGAGRLGATPKHVAVIGGSTAPSPNAPWRWLIVIAPVLLVALGGAYLASQWMASLRELAEPLRGQDQRPTPPEKAQRQTPADRAQRPAPTASSGADAREGGFNVADVIRLLPQADPGAGANLFKLCAACHTDDRNGQHKVGNNLWNIVGSPKAARPDYRYSQALRTAGGTWTYRELAEYLHDTRNAVPGTSMAFFGIKDSQRIANLLAYMRTRADKPVPLPK